MAFSQIFRLMPFSLALDVNSKSPIACLKKYVLIIPICSRVLNEKNDLFTEGHHNITPITTKVFSYPCLKIINLIAKSCFSFVSISA